MVSSAFSATPKTGTPCNKKGVTQIVGKFQYSCILSKKKLVWSKGVELKSKLPITSPSNTPSPSIQPSINASSNPSPSPKQLSDFEKLLLLDSVIGKSLREFNYYPKLSLKTESKNEYIFSPNSDSNFQKFVRDVTNISFDYFAEFFTDTNSFPIVYGTDQDFEWTIDYLESHKMVEKWAREEFTKRLKQEGQQVNIGGSDTWGDNRNLIYIIRGINRSPVSEADYSFIAHEYTHAVQNYLAGKQSSFPCWSSEGAAQFFGNALSARNYSGKYLNMRYWTFQMVKDAPQNLNPWNYSDSQWLDALTRLEKRGDLCNYDARLSYGPGIVMTEIQIADKGVSALMEWWSAAKTSEGWRSAFKRIYGMNIETWYVEKAIPAIKSAYSENK